MEVTDLLLLCWPLKRDILTLPNYWLKMELQLKGKTCKIAYLYEREENTSLIMAAAKGHLEVVKLFIKHGANINAKNK